MADSSKRTAYWLVSIVAVMATLSFAAVPFYSWFCRTTGFAGTTQTARKAPPADKVLEQTVTIRFDASKEAGMPWEFTAPKPATMTLKIGETGIAFFEAYNPTNHVTAGRASFNVTPDQAGGYFTKIACFCFNEQVLKPGERVQMPVTFYVDPSIVTDPEAKFIKEITLSYTFHSQPVPDDKQARNGADEAQEVN